MIQTHGVGLFPTVKKKGMKHHAQVQGSFWAREGKNTFNNDYKGILSHILAVCLSGFCRLLILGASNITLTRQPERKSVRGISVGMAGSWNFPGSSGICRHQPG